MLEFRGSKSTEVLFQRKGCALLECLRSGLFLLPTRLPVGFYLIQVEKRDWTRRWERSCLSLSGLMRLDDVSVCLSMGTPGGVGRGRRSCLSVSGLLCLRCAVSVRLVWLERSCLSVLGVMLQSRLERLIRWRN